VIKFAGSKFTMSGVDFHVDILLPSQRQSRSSAIRSEALPFERFPCASPFLIVKQRSGIEYRYEVGEREIRGDDLPLDQDG